jgi:hypothetical protein
VRYRQAPSTSLTHPRPVYPLSGCSPVQLEAPVRQHVPEAAEKSAYDKFHMAKHPGRGG